MATRGSDWAGLVLIISEFLWAKEVEAIGVWQRQNEKGPVGSSGGA
jgi:hypothetical protein